VAVNSPANIHVGADKLFNRFILEINGVRVGTLEEVNVEITSYNHLAKSLSGITLLLSQPPDEERVIGFHAHG